MLAQAREARFQPKVILQILLFVAVFWVGNSIASVILTQIRAVRNGNTTVGCFIASLHEGILYLFRNDI